MEIKELKNRNFSSEESKVQKAFNQFRELLEALKKMELPSNVIEYINQSIEEVNTSVLDGKPLSKLVKKKISSVTKFIEKELKIVPKGYYRTMWLALGMTVFGLPLGVAFGMSLGNMAFLGIGLPIGMAIGMAVGAGMDKKAFEEGRQLDFEIKQ